MQKITRVRGVTESVGVNIKLDSDLTVLSAIDFVRHFKPIHIFWDNISSSAIYESRKIKTGTTISPGSETVEAVRNTDKEQ